MKNSNTLTATQNRNTTGKSSNSPMRSSQLMELFEEELKEIYWAEKAMTKAIPKMIKKATSAELIEALTSHLEETVNQVSRVEKIFASIVKRAVSKKCEAIDGLIKETNYTIASCQKGFMCDAGIISGGQKVEHYEIASYGILRQFAKTLGLTEAKSFLEATLFEKKSANVKLFEIAQSINFEAVYVNEYDYYSDILVSM